MIRTFIIALLLLGGNAAVLPAYAADWDTQGETLQYQVYWGPLKLGQATLSFTPSKGKNYQAQAHVAGNMPFFKMDDTWTASGTITKTALQPVEYRAVQAENNYRANKRLAFDTQLHIMKYENLRGGEPPLSVPLPKDVQDPFTALYDLRRQGAPKQTISRTVMGLKRPFTLSFSAAEPLQRNGQKLLKVAVVKTETGKAPDHWQIYLADNAELTPVEIDAQLSKGGNFRAVLNGLQPLPQTNPQPE